MTAREFAIDVVSKLQQSGFEALWAGGCVRDERLGLQPDDYDIATNARPEQVQALFRRNVAIGAAFGVIEVIGPKTDHGYHTCEVATFRSDGVYLDGRRPDTVTFGTAEADASRRDFTINGLFFDPIRNQLIDYVGGQIDLQNKVLRAIGVAHDRFTEDKLRILRAVRMATRFDLAIDPATRSAAMAMASQIVVVSVERIAEELRKLFKHPMRARGVRLLEELTLLPVILPELRGPIPHEAIEKLPATASFELTLATLLHDQGKRGAEVIGRRLKLSNDEIRDVCWLVDRNGSLVDCTQPSRLYPLLSHPLHREFIDMHRAFGGDVSLAEATLQTIPFEQLDPPPLLTGDDLRAAGFKPSPRFKTTLETIRARQLDGELLTKADALTAAKALLE